MRFILLAVMASLGGLLFGYDTGVISGALLFIREEFHLSSTMQGLVAGIALGGAAAGAAVAGLLADRFGRRPVILVTGALFVGGALLSAVAGTLWLLLAGRLVVGVAIGVSSMLTPLYLAEIAPASHRGAMVSLNQTCLTLGILVSYLVGYALATVTDGWRWMLALGCVPGIILCIGMLILPESPRWLAGQRRMDKAEAALRFLRGRQDVAAESTALRTDLARDGAQVAPWSELLSSRVRLPIIVGVGLAVFQQVTGINTVIYFAPTIFEGAGLPSASSSILATAGVGLVNVLLTLVALSLLDRAGRRALLLIGLAGMMVTLGILSYGFSRGTSGSLAWLTVGALAAYVGFFAIGLGPVFWLLISEIFPLAVRGRAMSLATVANWAFNLIVTVTFLDLVHAVGRTGTFLIYAVLTLSALVFAWVLVPETKGRTLEEIEAAFEGRAALAAAPRAT